MKKFFLLMVLLFLGLQMFGQYKIDGEIKNHMGRILLIVQDEVGKYDTLGSSLRADGKFTFTGKVNEPTAAEIYAVDSPLRFPIFLEDGEYKVVADVAEPEEYQIEGGGKMQSIRNEFRKQVVAMQHEFDSARIAYEAANDKDNFFTGLHVKAMWIELEQKFDKLEDEFLKNNDNIVSAGMLAWRLDRLISDKSLPKKYALLGEQAKKTVPGRYMKPFADKIGTLVTGGIAPDLTMQTPDGKPLSIYGVKSKAKIVDFWASWCAPCRKANPHLKKVYEMYKSKGLEIISISLDTKEEAWLKAIEADGMTWLHMSDLKGWNSSASKTYQVYAIPRMLLLDENNRIVGEGFKGEDLEKKVKELLEK